MSEEGKCVKCGKPTKPMKNGGYFSYCWEHREVKSTPQPARTPGLSEDQLIEQYLNRFDKIVAKVRERHPNITSLDSVMNIAMHLHNNFYRK